MDKSLCCIKEIHV